MHRIARLFDGERWLQGLAKGLQVEGGLRWIGA